MRRKTVPSVMRSKSTHSSVQVNLEKTNVSLGLMEENLLGRDAALTATEEQLNKVEIIPSQMEVAPLHCTVDIRQKRRIFRNTKEIENM